MNLKRIILIILIALSVGIPLVNAETTDIFTVYDRPDSITVIVGTIDSGNVTSLFYADGNALNISEEVGSPGLDIRINFTDTVPADEYLTVTFANYLMYDGTPTHTILYNAYNFTSESWVFASEIFANGGYYDLNLTAKYPLVQHFISDQNKTWIQLYHPDPGNINDLISIDRAVNEILTLNETEHDPAFYASIRNEIIDDKWISANQSAGLNPSENAYTLEADVPVYEDFSTFTEVDSANDITITASRVSWDTMRRDASSYVYYDYGVNYFSDFQAIYTVVISAVDASGSASSQPLVEPFSVTNHLTDMDNQGDGAGESILTAFLIENTNNPDEFKWRLFQREDASTKVEVIGAVLYDVGTYYHTFGRSGTTVYMSVYNDSARTVLLETLTSDSGSTTYDYRYVEAPMSAGFASDPADYSTGYIENLAFDVGYAPNGTIWSTNLLENTTENAVTFLMNYTINPNTAIVVDFSEDNSSWVGTTVFDNGEEYCAVDLDPFNLNPLFIRFYLNSSDIAVTPLIHNYEILYRADDGDCIDNGNGEVVSELSPWDINWLASGIWLVLVAIGIFKNNKIMMIFAGFFGLILGFLLLVVNAMVAVAVICLNLYLIYEGTDS